MKSLSLFIERPVFATVINIMVILIGLVALSKLTVREYPDIDVPVVSVMTSYDGAAAHIVESQITDVLEESLSGIEGVDFIESKSQMGKSQITVQFLLNRDPDAAAADVRDRVARVRKMLPDEVDEPVIAKVEADATPFMYLALSSTDRSESDVYDYADRYIKDALQTIPGIAEIRLLGARKHAMRIWLQKDKMAAYKVTPADVANAIRAQNIELPAGLIESDTREFTVNPTTDLNTVEGFENVIVRVENGYQVRVSDVAKVALGVEDKRSFVRYNGKPAIGIGVVKQATANPVDVARSVHARIDEMSKTLPADLQLAIPHDTSIFINDAINSVWSTLFEAFVLVLLVIFLFLQTARATFVPMVAIPVSLIGAFAAMWAFGFSINLLTLLALVLAIGIVVDDAIVMLENIYRHIEMGKSPKQAAIDGSKEIGFAVVAMTITLAAVFTPVAFAEGKTGKLFTEFALTLTGAVLISGFVALTLSPMLCAKFLNAQSHEKKQSFIFKWFERGFDASLAFYKSHVIWLLERRWFGWSLLAVCLVVCFSLVPSSFAPRSIVQPLGDELAPVEDQGFFFTIAIAPEGSTPHSVSEAERGMEKVYDGMDSVKGYFVVAGWPDTTQGVSFVPLKSFSERSISSQEAVQQAMAGFFGIPDIIAFAMAPQSLGNGAGTPISLMLQTTQDYKQLLEVGNELVARMNANPGLNQVRLDLHLNKPELKVEIDRQKAAALGVQVSEISQALETMFGSKKVTRFKRANKQYEVMLQMEDDQRTSPEDLNDIYLRNNKGEMIALINLVTVAEETTASALPHFNKYRAANITAGINPGYSMGDAIEYIQSELYKISPQTKLDYKDTTREYITSGSTLVFAMVLALLFIYLVLAAQFESFIDPFIIMASVLPAFIGALVALKLTGNTLNIYSKIGLITLVGLITKHGILIVEFANQAMEHGKSKVDAILEAVETRYRPILMTAAAMVLGCVPLALATGSGAESRHAIGWVIVGGLSVGTILVLIIVPTVFMTFSRRKPGIANE